MQAARTTRSVTTVRKERTFRSAPYLDQLFGSGGRVDAYLQRQICERIRRARKEAGFTQEEMANLLNVTTRAYQNYERDRVPFRRLGEIARLTDVVQEWLLRGDQENGVPDQELLRDIAEGVGTLENSSEDVHRKLDELLARLARLEAGGSPPGETHRGQSG